jgi:hypothetical protein
MPIAVLQSFIDWIRKGYPEGVPQQDYIALLALLGSRLTHDEISGVALGLMATASDDLNTQTIADAIEMATHEPPSTADIERVRRRLEAAGADFGPEAG